MRYAFLFLLPLLAIGLFGCDRDENPIVGMDALSAVYVGAVNGEAGSYCTKLYAGQNIEAGLVCAEVIDNGDTETLCITYTTTGGWELQETHLWVGESLTDMPQTRKGNPVVGNFPYHSGSLPKGTTTYQFCVDLGQFGAEGGAVGSDLCDALLYAAAHAVAAKDNNGDGSYDQTETGWGNGNPIATKGNWATYFTITLDCRTGGPPGTETGETAFGYSCDEATCFLDIVDEDGSGFNRWGWSNGSLAPGTYYFDIYAGAGQCDLTKGTLVGLLIVDYDGTTAKVKYTTCGTYKLDEVHLYVGNEILPRNNGEYTVAPGQYPYIQEDVNAQEYEFSVPASGMIYVVAHAVVVGDYGQGDCGDRGCFPPCTPGFDEAGFGAILDGQNNDPGVLKIKVQYPYSGGPAYFPTTYIDWNGDGTADITTQSWCVDLDHTIGNNTWYCAVLYSSFDDLTGLDDTRWQNLDVVNWILNQKFVGTDAGGGLGIYTYADVQYAIWHYVENSNQDPGGVNLSRANAIIAAAAAAVPVDDPTVNYEPPCDGVVGVILKPVDCSSGALTTQILIAQVLVAEYPGICSTCP